MTKILPRLCLALLFLPSIVLGQDPQSFRVVRVVDGDTLVLSDGQKIRLVGVDTPEVHTSNKLYSDAKRTGQDVKTIRKLGKKASIFVENLVKNQEVTLQFDSTNIVRHHRDYYGRTLAYVYFKPQKFDKPPPWLASDVYFSDLYKTGFLNALIIYAGYGSAYTKYPFEHMDQFQGYAKSAREAGRGLWQQE